MKKIFCSVAILILVFSMSGCNDDKPKRTHNIEKVDHTDDVPMP